MTAALAEGCGSQSPGGVRTDAGRTSREAEADATRRWSSARPTTVRPRSRRIGARLFATHVAHGRALARCDRLTGQTLRAYPVPGSLRRWTAPAPAASASPLASWQQAWMPPRAPRDAKRSSSSRRPWSSMGFLLSPCALTPDYCPPPPPDALGRWCWSGVQAWWARRAWNRPISIGLRCPWSSAPNRLPAKFGRASRACQSKHAAGHASFLDTKLRRDERALRTTKAHARLRACVTTSGAPSALPPTASTRRAASFPRPRYHDALTAMGRQG